MVTEESRSLGCARCGDCCEDIYLGSSMENLEKWTTEALRDVPDPSTDEGWLWWISEDRGRDAWRDTTLSRDMAVFRYAVGGDWRLNADFITRHWHETSRDEAGAPRYGCDRFNAATRLCEAREGRPPVCSGYPWYHHGVRSGVITKEGSRCSYLLDLPPADRPEGARPLIPVEVLRG